MGVLVWSVGQVVLTLLLLGGPAAGQDRRPTISFITQPEIVTDIGGNVSL